MQSQHLHFRPIAVLLTAHALFCAMSPVEVRAQDNVASPPRQTASEGDKPSGGSDFLDMDIEQLRKTSVAAPSFDVEVTSVTKHESTVGRSPAAIFVITQEMIRRSGCTTIPDLLRMVPGVQVAQINSHTWAIAVRGFNGQFSNKLLVLIDGRSVYSEVTSGVYWDMQDYILDDIERIEVIRGPGATLWGVNAVNGVINIITKKAQDTQGLYINAGGGSHDRLIDGFRYGNTNGDGLYWRMYGKHFERGPDYNAAEGGGEDSWRVGRGGFRLDWELDRHKQDTLTVQGDYYGGLESQQIILAEPFPPYGPPTMERTDIAGANVLARFNHVVDKQSDWFLQTYFDRTLRDNTTYDGTLISAQQVNTFDVEFQHRFPLANNHSVTWGTNYRLYRDYLPGSFSLSYDPEQRTTDIFNMFVQDEITLKEDLLSATIGCKFSNEYFTGFQYQPTARLLLTPDERHAIWAAVSRAVRTPSRDEEDFTVTEYAGPVPVPTFLRGRGSNIVAEDVVAYELGYRTQATDRFAWDIALFYNVYDNLNLLLIGAPFWERTYRVVPITISHGASGQTYGLELSGQWTLTDRWRVSAWYGFLKMYTEPNTALETVMTQGDSPQNQAYLQSSWDIGKDWRFDMGLRYVDCLTSNEVPRYIEMDLRLAWRPNEHFEAALVGQNLLDAHHLEFPESLNEGLHSNEVPRSVYASATWRY